MFKIDCTLFLPLVATLALCTAAHAEKKETRVSKGLTSGQFIRNCEGMNGTVGEGSQSSDGVKCTLPGGTTADCSFGPKDAYCEVTTPGRSIPGNATKGLLGASTLAPVK